MQLFLLQGTFSTTSLGIGNIVTFAPENLLEESLVKAANDPAHRPQFYKDLSGSDLFIIQHGKEPPSGHSRITLEEGMPVQIQSIEHNGKPYIPVFTSLQRLQLVLSGEAAYLGINALELMKLTKGAELFLNPGSAYGKEFTKEEIASIVDGSIWLPSERYVVQKEVKVMIGQPKEYPEELVQALSRFFKTKKAVKRAWLAHIFNPDDGQPPHTLIAIDVQAGFDEISAEAGIVVRNVKIQSPPVDFMPITGKGGIENHFLNGDKPFYIRRLFGIF